VPASADLHHIAGSSWRSRRRGKR